MNKIGVVGLALQNPQLIGGNLGCNALSYSFFEILNKIAEEKHDKYKIVVIKTLPWEYFIKRVIKKILKYDDAQLSYYNTAFPSLHFSSVIYFNIRGRIYFSKKITNCCCVFDFTAGDSFTDIYGDTRFLERTRLKEKIINKRIPLILGSQTIGPFVKSEHENYAAKILRRCYQVFVRDDQSAKYVKEISSVQAILTTDVAFFLPYKKYLSSKGKKIVGFNPSGLLWTGGYTKNNQFGLTVDYKDYCRMIIKYLLQNGYEVHLIVHAYFVEDQNDEFDADNDILAVDALYKEFPSTIKAPLFATPMDAKSYIAGTDLFIGARMHATIGAISAGIPVIPFSYSRKFEGLFYSLGYPYVVEGTKWSTEKAIEQTKSWISNKAELVNFIFTCKKKIEVKNNFLLAQYSKTIESLIR